MAALALVLWAAYGVVALVFRMALQLRLTGSTGVHGLSGRPFSAEWLAGLLFVAAIVVGVGAAVLQANDVLDPLAALDRTWVHVVGIALYAVGLAGVALAQIWMGSAWRIGVDESERTELVTGGPFRFVRNPIYAAMFPTILGLGLLVGNVVALAAFVLILVGLELQVRVVEEPHLLRTHGAEYSAYAARVGRFLPGVGRIRG